MIEMALFAAFVALLSVVVCVIISATAPLMAMPPVKPTPSAIVRWEVRDAGDYWNGNGAHPEPGWEPFAVDRGEVWVRRRVP